MGFWPRNLITVEGRIVRCWLFSFRAQPEQVRRHIPHPLEIVTFGDSTYWNVVFCELECMRPVGLPKQVGVRYRHIAYRLHVQFRPKNSEPIRGLYFVRSDANSRLIVGAGNRLTDFAFHFSEIAIDRCDSGSRLRARAHEDLGCVDAVVSQEAADSLPAGSCFASVNEAVKNLTYPPCGLSLDDRRKTVNVLRITRDENVRRERAVRVASSDFGFFRDKGPVVLELCTEVEPIDYRWNRAERIGYE